MSDIIENMEHPLIAEMRQQVEEARQETERKHEEVEQLQSDLDERHYCLEKQEEEIYKIFNDFRKKDCELTLTEMLEEAQDRNNNISWANGINMFEPIVEALKIEPKTIIKEKEIIIKEIPIKIRDAINELANDINTY